MIRAYIKDSLHLCVREEYFSDMDSWIDWPWLYNRYRIRIKFVDGTETLLSYRKREVWLDVLRQINGCLSEKI